MDLYITYLILTKFLHFKAELSCDLEADLCAPQSITSRSVGTEREHRIEKTGLRVCGALHMKCSLNNDHVLKDWSCSSIHRWLVLRAVGVWMEPYTSALTMEWVLRMGRESHKGVQLEEDSHWACPGENTLRGLSLLLTSNSFSSPHSYFLSVSLPSPPLSLVKARTDKPSLLPGSSHFYHILFHIRLKESEPPDHGLTLGSKTLNQKNFFSLQIVFFSYICPKREELTVTASFTV